jgi:putative endonuclease
MSRARLASDKKQRAWRFGRNAETICAWVLRLKGYQIVARDFRVSVGEIDLVARRGRVLAFVEVKARADREAVEALTPRQRRRIVRAAEAFVRSRRGYRGFDLRFDVMLLRRRGWPRHLVDAWRTDDRL